MASTPILTCQGRKKSLVMENLSYMSTTVATMNVKNCWGKGHGIKVAFPWPRRRKMDQGIYTAAAGAIGMEARLNIISNNIANINTIGFKKDDISFEEFERLLDTSTLAQGQYKRIPTDVIAEEGHIDKTQGPVHHTGNPLDLAIIGKGFFVVKTPKGMRYTRAGNFHISLDGLLVDINGNAVQGEGGDIALEQGKVIVSPDGNINENGDSIDKLKIVDIPSKYLVKEGKNLFNIRKGGTPAPVDIPSISQGSLEMSNVEAVKEMVGLITTQRAYESFQKVIKTFKDTYSMSIRDIGTLA